MYTSGDLAALAANIYQDINSPTFQSPAFIFNVLIQSGTVGDLNNKLSSSFYVQDTGTGPFITDGGGGYGQEEAAISSLMYQTSYYRGRQLALLDGAGNSWWTSLAEGDSKLNRTDITKIAAAYGALYTTANNDLRLAVHDWGMRVAVPQSVVANQSYASPSPS